MRKKILPQSETQSVGDLGLNKQPPPPPDTSDAGIQKSAMGRLAEGLAGPSKGLESSIGQGRNAVAQFARDTQRQAAGTALKAGAQGQGTQTALGQEVRQSVMGKLAANEANNAQMISAESKSFMDKALEVGHQNKTLAQQQSQFDVSSGQQQQQINNQASQFATSSGQQQQQINNQASQFATTSGQNQQQIDNQKAQFTQSLDLQKDELASRIGQQNMQNMIQLGGDIPVIAAKVMDQVMGKNGTPLSSAEKADLGKWYEDQKAKGAKIDDQMGQLIDKMVKDTVDPVKTPEDFANDNRNTAMTAILGGTKPLDGMTPADWSQVASNPAMMQTLAQNNPKFKPSVVIPKTKSEADWKKAGIAAGDVVMVDGKPIKIVQFKTEKYSNWSGNTRKRNYTVGIDIATNKQIRIGDTGEYDPD